MEIGVVVHGPGIVDSGWALKIIDILSDFGDVRSRLGGTMGRTAVIDAGLEGMIDISLKLLPSQSLELFNREHVDVIFLLNYGKSSETGQVFGYKVFNHYFKQISNEDYLATNHKPLYESSIPVIQIERPGEEDGSIISWNTILNEQLAKSRKSKRSILGLGKKNMVENLSFNFEELFDGLKMKLDLIEVSPEEVVEQYFSNAQNDEDEKSIESILESYEDYGISSYTYRKIHGTSPDENIFVNGIVVGYADADSIVLVARDGIIVDILNGTLKNHGIEKLGPVDLDRVIVKTGLLRKSEEVNPRILSSSDLSIRDTERTLYSGEISDDVNSFKVAYVDHAAYDIYKFKDFDLVLTVGDDTSLVASDILYRLDIPIIGITDGDLDKVVETGFVNPKSTFIELASGFDDMVGHYIYEELFLSKETLEIPFDEADGSVAEFKEVMLNVFKSHVLEKVKEIVPSFIEKDHEYNVVGSYHEGADGNPELVEELDEFIDGFEYDAYGGSEEPYLEEISGSPVKDDYFDNPNPQIDEIYIGHDLEDLSDEQLEEIIAEHGYGEYEEVYLDEDDSLIYGDEYPQEDTLAGEYSQEESFVEDYPDEEEYLENLAYGGTYDESQLEDHLDSHVEEIYVEHEAEEEIVYEDVPAVDFDYGDGLVYEDVPAVDFDYGDGLVYEDVPAVDFDYGDGLVYEDVHYEEETPYEELPAEEVYLDETLEDEASQEPDMEVDGSDGWAEYLEEEFGDSSEISDDSNND